MYIKGFYLLVHFPCCWWKVHTYTQQLEATNVLYECIWHIGGHCTFSSSPSTAPSVCSFFAPLPPAPPLLSRPGSSPAHMTRSIYFMLGPPEIVKEAGYFWETKSWGKAYISWKKAGRMVIVKFTLEGKLLSVGMGMANHLYNSTATRTTSKYCFHSTEIQGWQTPFKKSY